MIILMLFKYVTLFLLFMALITYVKSEQIYIKYKKNHINVNQIKAVFYDGGFLSAEAKSFIW